jgi:hypothetical protein
LGLIKKPPKDMAGAHGGAQTKTAGIKLRGLRHAGKRVKSAGEDAGATKGEGVVRKRRQGAGLKPGAAKTTAEQGGPRAVRPCKDNTAENTCGAN